VEEPEDSGGPASGIAGNRGAGAELGGRVEERVRAEKEEASGTSPVEPRRGEG
jgi:hypothetical protein